MAEEEQAQRGFFTKLFGSFTKTFWVVNSLELFERGAYYGTVAILGVHVVEHLLVEDPAAAATWGFLYSFLIILLYYLPLFSAALAEKIGYKTMLLIAFAFMISGYFSLSQVRPGEFGFLVFSFLLVGIGAGLFKPIISATVAHVTKERQRNLAYSIYYWMINLGAFAFPLSLGLFFPQGSIYYPVFAISGCLIIANVIITFIFFRNPVEPRRELKVLQALVRIKPALKDRKFVILLSIYAGFWFMFAYNHTFLPVYMVQFERLPSTVSVFFLQAVNPLTIILFGPFLGKFVEKYKSMNVMMFGMVIFCVGFAINGWSNSSFLFILGIIIFSIGEFVVHPGFISYVSKIAPKERVSIYLACIFISTGMGQVVGGFVQGIWYNHYAVGLHQPKIYIGLLIAVGLLTLTAFILYNRFLIRDTLRREPKAVVDVGLWTKTPTLLVAVVLVPVVVYAGYLGGVSTWYGEEEEVSAVDWSTYDVMTEALGSESGNTNEGSDEEVLFLVDRANVANVTFTLTWTDEPAQGGVMGIRYTNQPDTFSFTVTPPNGTAVSSRSVSNAVGSPGSIELRIPFDAQRSDPYFNWTGDYSVVVACEQAGDHEPFVSIGGLRDVVDAGNAWTISAEVEFYIQPNL